MLVKLRDHLEKLHHFLHIAKSGSFRKAADVLHVTQPTLSYSVKLLEEAIGQSLFHRSSTGVKLTQSGSILLKFCEKYFAELDDLERQLRAPEEPFAGLLKIGTYESLAVHFWPRFISVFSQKYPEIGLNFLSGSSASLREKLLGFDADVTVSVELSDHSGISKTELFRDQYSFYAHPSMAEGVEIGKCQRPLLFVPFAKCMEQKTLLQYLKEAGLSGRSLRYELESFEAVREFAMAGLGVALMPTRLAQKGLKEGTLAPVEVKGFAREGFGTHRVMACVRSSETERPLIKLLLSELARDAGASMH